jgi:hypothetical protein
MAVADPFVSLRDWRSSLYRGNPDVIEQFLAGIDATLSPGWVRDREYERTRLRPDRIRCYLFDQPGDAAVRLGLERMALTRVRGDLVQVLRRPPSGDAERIARIVAEFADGCVLPAANAVGARCTRPAFGPRSAVTLTAEMLFNRFAEIADGEWPLTDRVQELWDELVSGCLAEHVGIDRDELRQWLEDNGWEPEAATALTDRLFADARWLAKRLAVMVP